MIKLIIIILLFLTSSTNKPNFEKDNFEKDNFEKNNFVKIIHETFIYDL